MPVLTLHALRREFVELVGRRDCTMSEPGTRTKYAYDRFGNRWQQNGPHPYQPSFDANNRITSGTGVAYDAAGDTTGDGTTTYTYDAEGRVTSAYNATSGTSTYVYDAAGHRVQKTTAAGGTVNFLYDLGGHEITQISSTGAWTRGEVYAGGRHIATYSGGTGGTTYFIHSDWLGTERVRSAVNGTSAETCTSLPFGDWLTCAGSDVSPMHLTGKEHDWETGLENFGARYDSSAMGRFMSADEPGAGWAQEDPQSFNLYSYVEGNPVNSTDPSGRVFCRTDPNSGQKICDVSNVDYFKNPKKYDALGYKHYYCSCDSPADIRAWNRHMDPGVPNISTDFLYLYSAGSLIRGGIGLARGAWGLLSEFSAANVPNDMLVIGKMPDLEALDAIGPGERTLLEDLPDLGSDEANLAQNQQVLLKAMDEGQPIRDASVDTATGQPKAGSESGFLKMERDTLRNHGWTLAGDTWYPPNAFNVK